MVINKVLDEVFSTWSNVAVMRALKNYAVGVSGREVARVAGMSAKSCLNSLTSLENLGVVNRVRGGRDHLFSLNRDHFLVKQVVIPNLNSEKKFVQSLFADIKKGLGKNAVSIILFGSTARREENIQSDLDICIVFKNAASKKKVEKIITDLSFFLNKKYGVSLAPFYISEADFAKRAKTKKSPVADIIKEGRQISGKTIKELISG